MKSTLNWLLVNTPANFITIDDIDVKSTNENIYIISNMLSLIDFSEIVDLEVILASYNKYFVWAVMLCLFSQKFSPKSIEKLTLMQRHIPKANCKEVQVIGDYALINNLHIGEAVFILDTQHTGEFRKTMYNLFFCIDSLVWLKYQRKIRI